MPSNGESSYGFTIDAETCAITLRQLGWYCGGCDFVLPNSTYAQPKLSPKDNLSGLVWVSDLESSRNSFCNAFNVKFLVFNDGSKSRGIPPPRFLSLEKLLRLRKMFRDRKFQF